DAGDRGSVRARIGHPDPVEHDDRRRGHRGTPPRRRRIRAVSSGSPAAAWFGSALGSRVLGSRVAGPRGTDAGAPVTRTGGGAITEGSAPIRTATVAPIGRVGHTSG